MRRLRRWTILIAFVAAGLALAACQPVGYDNLMLNGCFVDYNHAQIVDATSCGSAAAQDVINSGNYWALTQGPAVLKDCNYHIDGPSNVLIFRAFRPPTTSKLTAGMAINGDPCHDNLEIAYDLNNGQAAQKIVGLHSLNSFGYFEYNGDGHVAVQAYMNAGPDGQRHTVSIVLPPFQANQPSAGGNWSSGCVMWHGSPLPNHHFIILNGGCFGLSLCVAGNPGCPGDHYTNINIDWSAILNWIQANANFTAWHDLWGELGSITASIHVELDTFTPAGGQHGNWVAVNQNLWSTYYCDGGFVC
jgi:hypothetical protein